jgi:hypothetical protein
MTRLGVTKSRWRRRQTLNKTNWLNRKREAVPIVHFFVALEQQKEEKSVVSTSYRIIRLNEDVTIWSKKWFFLMEQLKLQILKHSSFNGAAKYYQLVEMLAFLMGYESYLRKRGISFSNRLYKPTGKYGKTWSFVTLVLSLSRLFVFEFESSRRFQFPFTDFSLI